MITINLTHPGYKEAFKDCDVGEEKTITFTVTKKSDTELVGELDTYEEGDIEDEPAAKAEPAYASGASKSKPPKGVMIAIGNMK